MDAKQIIKRIKSNCKKENIRGMARYGINPKNNYGNSIRILRGWAKDIGRDHELAQELWGSGIHDARLLAVFVEEPDEVTEEQMEKWASDFDSWDVCDQACTSLFDITQYGWKKAIEWADRKEEFVKRGAFAIIAGLAVHDKKASNEEFIKLLPLIIKASTDDRNYIKKAVSWALRNIGKRNIFLNKRAIQTAKEIQMVDSKSAHWIASDAIKELTSEKVQKRIKKKA